MRCALALLLVGCAAAPEAKVPPTAGTSAPPRIPDGVVLEAPSTPAASSGRAIVVMQEPAPDEAVQQLVFNVFEAMRRRDRAAVAQLVADEAVRTEGGAGYGNREALIDTVAAKYRSVDPAKIAPAEIAAPERIERFGLGELEALGVRRPEAMRPADLYIRITMPPPRTPGDKIFEEVTVWIARIEAGKLRLVTWVDDGR